MHKILLLPGLDGSGFCFSRISEILSREYPCHILSYPAHLSDYADLREWVLSKLESETHYIIVTHSFGGPLGVLVAQALGNRAKGLVLCATFCQPPMPRWVLQLVSSFYPKIIRQKWAVHFLNFMLCNGKNLAVADELHRALLQSPDTAVAHRIRILTALDMRQEIRSLILPCLALTAARDRVVWLGKYSHFLSKGIALTIDGPHGLMELSPEMVAATILTFIKKEI
jgi:pimeloyl-[acyl-carrier protein] methyl ester esterase